MGSDSGLFGGLPGWLRRRNPRLSGTLHIRDALGHDMTIPLRGRAAVLTTGGTGLTGHGEVWAVHTDPDATVVSLMIIYGHTESPDDRESGLCPAGATVTLSGASFTWHCPTTAAATPSTVEIPHPRTGESTAATPRGPGNSAPSAGRDPGPIRNSRTPRPRAAPNAHPATPNLRQRVQAIVRDITHPPRH
ncbi:hypothetical protein [Actinoplanes sp. HUAS TT8]|uniref:hypothetical protein n=1 Tax=Actinoplanes sp. HUAS TT8 TaxID=3447453 RepID=UPI003F51C399